MKPFYLKGTSINNMHALPLLAMCLFFLSCNNNTETPKLNTLDTDSVIIYDTNNETDYSALILNSNNNTITLFQTTDDGYITNFNSIFINDEKVITASFNENGLLSGIGTEGSTIAFSNYRENLVDIAIILGNETFLFKDFESPNNWSEIEGLLQLNLPLDISRSGNIEDDGDEQLSKVWKLIGDQFKNLIEFVGDAKDSPGANASLKYLCKIITDSGLFMVDNKAVDYATFIGELATGLAATTPWGTLWTVVSNYDTYVDLVEDFVYNIAEIIDQFENERDNGIGAINSGYGKLKATLSWNFYADIDLHAIDPSDSHIYWDDPNSVTGGYLDVDNTYGGPGAIENIFWEKAPDGDYIIFIDYYGESWENDKCESGTCTVSVYYNGHGKTYKVYLQPYEYEAITAISLPSGTFYEETSRSIDIKLVINNKSTKTKQRKQ